MTMRTIQVRYLGSDDLELWHGEVIPQIGETVRLDAHQNGKQYRVVNVIHRLWSHRVFCMTVPIIVLTEMASEVSSAAQNE